jgi:succinate-semialdehyde dehydrogenase/glutarate-semialdehyde dehydrogenase
MSETPITTSGVRIGGGPAEPRSPLLLEVVEPATGSTMSTVAAGGVEDALWAAESASDALGSWSDQSLSHRATALRTIAEALDEAAEGHLPEVVSRETGKLLDEARAEVRFSARYFEWFADVIGTSHSQTWEVVPGVRHLVRWRAVGVVAVLTPWNFPVSIPARKIAPALAAGCTVVFRPSQYTPSSSIGLVEIIERLLPPGVVNTVCGEARAITDAWLDEASVRGLSFTGSTEVGRVLATEAGRRLKMATLELGGRAPFVVTASADVDQSVRALMVAKFRNNGESCIAANNVWVHRSLWDAFVETFIDQVEQIRLGDPLTDGVDLGPLRKPSDVSRLSRWVEEAEERGAEIVVGGETAPREGFFLRPVTCLLPDPDTRLWSEEVFGPVTPLRPFETFSEVVEGTNRSNYGLAGYLMAKDVDEALDMAARLEIGLIGVNVPTPNTPQVPFGGWKDSGFGGYEGGWAGLEPFIEYQSLAVAPMSGVSGDA